MSHAGLYSNATIHTPTDVTHEAVAYAKRSGADSIVSFGGGDTIGLGKAIPVRTGLPHICVPATYAGSEMTSILGEVEGGRKITRSDLKILPGTDIYDVDFTLTLPPCLSATSGVKAIAHAAMEFVKAHLSFMLTRPVEALYARNTNPVMLYWPSKERSHWPHHRTHPRISCSSQSSIRRLAPWDVSW